MCKYHFLFGTKLGLALISLALHHFSSICEACNHLHPHKAHSKQTATSIILFFELRHTGTLNKGHC